MPEDRDSFFKQFFSDEPGPEGETPKPDARSIMPQAGTLANMLNMGASGAQIGAALGGGGGPIGAIPTAIGGGLLGAGLGLALPPSPTPMTDVGASAAELLASKFLPGVGAVRRLSRLARGAGITAATAAGAAAGQIGDKKADFIIDTNLGQVGVYAGVTAAGLALFGGMRPVVPTRASEAVKALTEKTGVEVPLSFSQRTGKIPGFERFLVTGTKIEKELAQAQNREGMKALDKLVGVFPTAEETALEGVSVKTAAEAALAPFTKKVKGGVKIDWKSFAASAGLTPEELNGFLGVLQQSPETIVDRLVQTGAENPRGIFAFNSLFKALPDPDKEQLGTALVARILQRSRAIKTAGEYGEAISGRAFQQALNDFGSDRLTKALGPDRAEALHILGVVMDATDPFSKLASESVTVRQRMISYLSQKGLFAIGFGGAAGAGSGAALGNVIGGMAVGSTLAVPITVVVGRLMAQPRVGKRVLVELVNGDASAANRLVRLLLPKVGGGKVSEEPTPPPRGSAFDNFFQEP